MGDLMLALTALALISILACNDHDVKRDGFSYTLCSITATVSVIALIIIIMIRSL